MKKSVVLFASLMLLTLTVQRVYAQSSATVDNADAAAYIVKIITLSEEQKLHFGDIVPSASPGTVTVSTAGVRSKTGGVTLLTQFTTQKNAIFKVTGEPDFYYTITLPADNAVELTLTGGDPMPLTGFNHDAGLNPQLDTDGEVTFNVGATLNVNANQKAGLYTANYSVTVAYN